MNELTQYLLKELFDYQDGELYWKVARHGIRNNYHAGTIRPNGYRSIKIDGKQYLAHRLIFLYHHGYLPEFLDHIDGDKSNNIIENLRPITNQENCMKQVKTKNIDRNPTSSIYKGVSWYKRYQKWVSYIYINTKRKTLGYFNSEIDAALAYNKAAAELFGEFAGLNNIITSI